MINKVKVTITIGVHPIQAELISHIEKGLINLQEDSLRSIAIKLMLPKVSAQQVKHHLEQLVKIGFIQQIYGEYRYIDPDKLSSLLVD